MLLDISELFKCFKFLYNFKMYWAFYSFFLFLWQNHVQYFEIVQEYFKVAPSKINIQIILFYWCPFFNSIFNTCHFRSWSSRTANFCISIYISTVNSQHVSQWINIYDTNCDGYLSAQLSSVNSGLPMKTNGFLENIILFM